MFSKHIFRTLERLSIRIFLELKHHFVKQSTRTIHELANKIRDNIKILLHKIIFELIEN